MRTILLLIVSAPAIASAQLLPLQPAERCTAAPASMSATAWLDRAAAQVMPPAGDARVLRYRATQDILAWEQSDRMYAPFIPAIFAQFRWTDAAGTVEGRQTVERPVMPGRYPSQVATSLMSYTGRDTVLQYFSQSRTASETIQRENPWMTLAEWRKDAAAAKVVQRCFYRDAWRVVLQRGDERLYLSESDATPVKTERIEPHYLWGQVKAEYLWSTWWGINGGSAARFPAAVFRIFDGYVYESARFSSFTLVPADSAARLTTAGATQAALPPGVQPAGTSPDTVRIAENAYLLVTPAYTETVTLQKDTVFLLDATTGEARARGDSALIAQLFPGRHPTVVVVTDLAWPHISGLRFWVARGATVVSDRTSEDFIRRVIDRKWTLAPDALEKARATAKLRFRPVTDSLRLAGGALVVHALHGTSTETALGVWIPAIRYLWAGDYVQGDPASPYWRDVVRTVKDLGLAPEKVGAQHIRLTDWTLLENRK